MRLFIFKIYYLPIYLYKMIDSMMINNPRKFWKMIVKFFRKYIKLYFIALLKYELFEELFLYKVPLMKLYKLIKVQFAYILNIIYIAWRIFSLFHFLIWQDIDLEGFQQFLDCLLEVSTPEDLCRNLFSTFVRPQEQQAKRESIQVSQDNRWGYRVHRFWKPSFTEHCIAVYCGIYYTIIPPC